MIKKMKSLNFLKSPWSLMIIILLIIIFFSIYVQQNKLLTFEKFSQKILNGNKIKCNNNTTGYLIPNFTCLKECQGKIVKLEKDGQMTNELYRCEENFPNNYIWTNYTPQEEEQNS
jgi:hypothetical protein